MRILMVVFLLGIAIDGKAYASSMVGNDIYDYCQEDAEIHKQTFCTGYIIGLLEGLNYGAAVLLLRVDDGNISADEINKKAALLLGFCASPSVTIEQYRDIAVKYMSERPEIRHHSAKVTIHNSWIEAFPCD